MSEFNAGGFGAANDAGVQTVESSDVASLSEVLGAEPVDNSDVASLSEVLGAEPVDNSEAIAAADAAIEACERKVEKQKAHLAGAEQSLADAQAARAALGE